MRPACFRIHETGTDGSAIDLLGPLCNTFRHESAETFLEYVFFPHLVFGRIFTANFDQPMIQDGLRLQANRKALQSAHSPRYLNSTDGKSLPLQPGLEPEASWLQAARISEFTFPRFQSKAGMLFAS